jgi:hypothetical protein
VVHGYPEKMVPAGINMPASLNWAFGGKQALGHGGVPPQLLPLLQQYYPGAILGGGNRRRQADATPTDNSYFGLDFTS